MKVELTSPVEGKQPGDTVDVKEARGQWLLANGYAKPASGDNPDDFGIYVTDVDAKDDPTLAENREAPGEKPKSAEAPKRAPKTEEEKSPKSD